MTPEITLSDLSPMTADQKKQLRRFLEDTLNAYIKKFGPTKYDGQLILENGKPLKSDILKRLDKMSRPLTFADEEIEGHDRYPADYAVSKIYDQCVLLKHFFELPNEPLSYVDRNIYSMIKNHRIHLPRKSEGWFCIPKWQTVAPTYNKATERVWELINHNINKQPKKSPGSGHIEILFDQMHLSELKEKQDAMAMLGATQFADFLIMPAQFGLKHAGRSIRRSCRVMYGPEFGLGAYETGIMILTHPKRLDTDNYLNISAPGDNYNPCTSGDPNKILTWYCETNGKIEIGTSSKQYVSMDSASASGFIITYD